MSTGVGDRKEGKKEGDWGERVRNACYKNPLLFISVDTSICKFLIGWAVMSNLFACILADKHDEGIKEMCSTGVCFGRSKLLQSCSNFTLKRNWNQLTVIACLAGRDAQEVLYTGFVQMLCGNSKRLRFLSDTCNADIHKTPFSKNIYCLEWTSKWYRLLRESWSFGKNYPLSFLIIVYNPPFTFRISGYQWLFYSLWPFCLMRSHKTDHCLS